MQFLFSPHFAVQFPPQSTSVSVTVEENLLSVHVASTQVLLVQLIDTQSL
jgi:hypothetical protein